LTIYADTISPEMKPDKNFSFSHKNKLPFCEVIALLPQRPIVKDDYMVHFSYSFEITKDSGIIHVSMGSFNKPLAIYLMIDGENISYFITLPVPTSSNHKAHELITQILANSGVE
jgi:tRNA (guanine-N7-)-methyltransferase